jgi:hypothetical protein
MACELASKRAQQECLEVSQKILDLLDQHDKPSADVQTCIQILQNAHSRYRNVESMPVFIPTSPRSRSDLSHRLTTNVKKV